MDGSRGAWGGAKKDRRGTGGTIGGWGATQSSRQSSELTRVRVEDGNGAWGLRRYPMGNTRGRAEKKSPETKISGHCSTD